MRAGSRLCWAKGPRDRGARDGGGNTPLLRAPQEQPRRGRALLIDAGADVNAKNAIHDSAYLLAGARGYRDILALTLAHGADLKSTNRYGGTALIPACERGHVEVVDMLRARARTPTT